VITLTGFLCTIIPFGLMFGLFGTSFEGAIPAWWCILEAVLYFIYRLLDEMDGKQARKTGNSSPVGLMFDHGCDSFTAALLCLMMSKMMQIGNGPLVMWTLLGITQSFHFATLEEYYIGGLFLGPFNGVTDGSALIISIFMLSGIVGNDIWLTQVTLPGMLPIRASQIVAWSIVFT